MAKQHDAWLQGLGLNVDGLLVALGAGAGAGAGGGTPTDAEGSSSEPDELPFGLLDPVEDPSDGAVSGGGAGVAGKGALATTSNDEESTEYFSGEYKNDEDGRSAKGAVMKRKSHDGATTETVGEIEISDEKLAVTGRKREADLVKGSGGLLPKTLVAKGDTGEGTASVEASASDDGIAVGAQANAGEASVTLGTQDDKSDIDQTTRVGFSEGVGGAGRIHFGDADQDGNPEFGLGADAGPFSFDVKSEDPLRKGVELMASSVMSAGAGPAAMLMTAQGNPLSELLLGDENLTKKLIGDPGQALADAKNFVSDAKQGVAGAIDDAQRSVEESVGEAVDAASDVVDQIADGAGVVVDAAGDAVDQIADGAGVVADAASDIVDQIADGAGVVADAAGDVVDQIADGAGVVVDAASTVADQVADAAGQAADLAAKAASEAAGQAADALVEVLDQGLANA